MVIKAFRWLRKRPIFRLFTIVGFLGGGCVAAATISEHPVEADSILFKSVYERVGARIKVREGYFDSFINKDTIHVKEVIRSPFISVQQLLKGNAAGVYVQENNGEPGTIQSMLVRGLSSPVFSNRDVSGVQPAVYLNGLPLLQDNPYLFNARQSDVNPIGTATNLLAGLNLHSIESIEVIKDPIRLAKLGPLAANGAIWIVTKDGYYGGTNVSFDASLGYVTSLDKIKMTNGAYEKNFRKQFYDAYGLNMEDYSYPDYLRNTNDAYFFGEPDWADDYYNSSAQYNANLSIGGGKPNANYLFLLNVAKNAGVADETQLNKYNFYFSINMEVINNLLVNTTLRGGRMERNRNKNLRDRYAEVGYLPSLATPLSPTEFGYSNYLDQYDLYKDDNLSNLVNGSIELTYKWKNMYVGAGFWMDYNNNVRRVFWPSTLMESVSYLSNFSGYNNRIIGKANAGYLFSLNKKHSFDFRWEGSIQSDLHHYNYIKSLDGNNDRTPSSTGGGFLSYLYADRLEANLVSSSFSVDYSYKNLLNIGALIRLDGTSRLQSDNRWLFTPAFSAAWNIKNTFFTESKRFSNLLLSASWARVGKMLETDRYSIGPQYDGSGLNWNSQGLIPTFNGFAAITRPYDYGWVDYGIGWPYSEKFEIGVHASFLNDNVNFSLKYYDNMDKKLSLLIPASKEFGYTSQHKSGMKVSNKGIDVTLGVSLPAKNSDKVGANFSVNLNYNWNELKKLPDNLNEVVIGDRKLQVGESIDEFWVYRNVGIYNHDNEVPAGLTMYEQSFQKGDPIWANEVKDNIIDEQDKVLKGHALPPLTGGLNAMFTYKKFDLGFSFYFAYGHSALNVRNQQRYDFTTLDTQNSLEPVKEIYFWQNTHNKNDLPIYNPLSNVHPYRLDQDLFLEKLSFLKLRTITLGYTLPLKKRENMQLPESLYVYLTANNLLTITDFSGDDPELTGFNGYYHGISLPTPRSLTLGLRFNF